MHPSLDHLEVFYRDLSPISARVFLHLTGASSAAGYRLAGTIRGPRSALGRTLPTTFTITSYESSRGGSAGSPSKDQEGLLARAVITDPCLWSTAMPALYDLHVELHQHSELIATTGRICGLRHLGVWKRSFRWENKRWVLRALAAPNTLADLQWDEWRETGTAFVCEQPTDDFCRAASEQGVLIVAKLSGTQGAPSAAELERLSRWPAVGIIVMPAEAWGTLRPAEIPVNIIRGSFCSEAELMEVVAGATQVGFCRVQDGRSFAAAADRSALPVVAVAQRSPDNSCRSFAKGRTAIDCLQRDLAAYGQYAGYVVPLDPF